MQAGIAQLRDSFGMADTGENGKRTTRRFSLEHNNQARVQMGKALPQNPNDSLISDF
jgi:hypothetical protein